VIRQVEDGLEQRSEAHDHAERLAKKVALVLSVAAVVLYGNIALAQSAPQGCRQTPVIPLTEKEPAPKLVVDAPLAGLLESRGVVVIPYCAEHMRIAPVFGEGALAVSPRVGHIHVTVDGAPWYWADASGTPLILRGLPSGAHSVLIELVDASHRPVDKGTVTFDVPKKAAASPSERNRRFASAERACEDLHGRHRRTRSRTCGRRSVRVRRMS
jgi:hypothetical protein